MIAFHCLPCTNARGNLLKALDMFQEATKEKTLWILLQFHTSWIHLQTACLPGSPDWSWIVADPLCSLEESHRLSGPGCSFEVICIFCFLCLNYKYSHIHVTLLATGLPKNCRDPSNLLPLPDYFYQFTGHSEGAYFPILYFCRVEMHRIRLRSNAAI